MSERLDSTVFRSEDWQQSQGEGVLEVRGNKSEIALFVNGAPLIYDAHDGGGSVGRLVTFLPGSKRLEAANFIAQAASSGFADAAPLHQQIAPLFQLLPDGQYQLRLEQVPPGYGSPVLSDYDLGPNWKEGEQIDTIWYYPEYGQNVWQPVLLWTQPESSLEDDTINKYLSLIERGERPALITIGAKGHAARFVLDGHHKLFACWCCGVKPHTLHIEFQFLVPIPWKLANDLVGDVPD
ncbi:MAG TPA: hypothetical protein VM821_04535, partial [Abditibacteriaceae bacterium]|nr:hypothetical protein [Abditibacteriaceae bacterium]